MLYLSTKFLLTTFEGCFPEPTAESALPTDWGLREKKVLERQGFLYVEDIGLVRPTVAYGCFGTEVWGL